MRLTSIILSALLLSCFCIFQAGVSGDPGDIAEPSISGANMDVPGPTITAPNMDMPAPNPKPLSKSSQNSNRAVTSTVDNTANSTVNASTDQPLVTGSQQEPAQMDASGKWSIKFNNSADTSMDLNLWSSGENRIMGYGTLTEAGAKNSLTASGSVSAQELTLTAKLANSDYTKQKAREYDLDLLMANSTLSGTYVLKSGEQFLSRGNATATKE